MVDRQPRRWSYDLRHASGNVNAARARTSAALGQQTIHVDDLDREPRRHSLDRLLPAHVQRADQDRRGQPQAHFGAPTCFHARVRRMAISVSIVPFLLAGLVAACGDGDEDGFPAGCPGSTLRCTLADPEDIGALELGAAEPLLQRRDLAPSAGAARTLVVFAQISDAHVTDSQSPLRVEAIDPAGGAVTSAFRPHEALTAQVLAAAEVSVNALHPEFVLETGDLVDNAQRNELSWALGILRGGTIRPDSGTPGYEGVQAATSPDPFLYRPDIDQPRHPGLLAAALKPFDAPGLTAPWLPLVSNHDILVQGNLPVDAALARVATGSRKLVAASRAVFDEARDGTLDPTDVPALLEDKAVGRFESVSADSGRRPLSAGEVVAAIEAASGVTADPAMRRAGLLAYHRTVAPGIVLIALDTANRIGGAEGVIPPIEIDWLRETLLAAEGSRILIASPTALEDTDGGGSALALIDAAAGVVAVLSGDTHRSLITPRQTASGGYWLIRTPSLVDFPQQARAFRLVELTDGRVALDTWLVDHAGAPGAPGYLGLAGISRALAELDFQGGRPKRHAGRREDRNVRLFLPG